MRLRIDDLFMAWFWIRLLDQVGGGIVACSPGMSAAKCLGSTGIAAAMTFRAEGL